MTRFTIAAALATALGLGLTGKADAQYVTRYTTITPNGGLVTTNQVYSPFGGYQAQRTYVSPFGSVQRQYVTGDVYGNTYGQANGFNPVNGAMYNRGFYNPSPIVYPYAGGYRYNYYRRW
jgi:hypothetical protein